jgi:carbonic anhydrase
MLNDLLARNEAWSKQRHAEEPDCLPHLAALQAPEFFRIGCSDSRVPTNVIAGLDPGEGHAHYRQKAAQ